MVSIAGTPVRDWVHWEQCSLLENQRPPALPEDGAPPSARRVAPKGPGRASAPRSAASAA